MSIGINLLEHELFTLGEDGEGEGDNDSSEVMSDLGVKDMGGTSLVSNAMETMRWSAMERGSKKEIDKGIKDSVNLAVAIVNELMTFEKIHGGMYKLEVFSVIVLEILSKK